MASKKSRRREPDLSFTYGSDVCVFCGIKDEDEILYGKFAPYKGLTLHTNCLFLASSLYQRKNNTQGILGFCVKDIEKELRRGRKLACSYCEKPGATIGCCYSKCKIRFHLPCGIKNGSMSQFFDSFRSYCKVHRPQQKNVEVTEDLYCYICCEEIPSHQLESCLYPPCCKRNFMHKMCLQKQAVNAGYFFKCPFCNNEEEFVKEMKEFGINVPEKDASWELEENAYQDLLYRPQCDAPVCKSTKGREYRGSSRSSWYLLTCTDCGSHARHRICENMKTTVKHWICKDCKNLKTEINKLVFTRQTRSKSSKNTENNV